MNFVVDTLKHVSVTGMDPLFSNVIGPTEVVFAYPGLVEANVTSVPEDISETLRLASLAESVLRVGIE